MKERISKIVKNPIGDIHTLEIAASKVSNWKDDCLSNARKSRFSAFTLLIVLINQCHTVYLNGTGSFKDILIICICALALYDFFQNTYNSYAKLKRSFEEELERIETHQHIGLKSNKPVAEEATHALLQDEYQ